MSAAESLPSAEKDVVPHAYQNARCRMRAHLESLEREAQQMERALNEKRALAAQLRIVLDATQCPLPPEGGRA